MLLIRYDQPAIPDAQEIAGCIIDDFRYAGRAGSNRQTRERSVAVHRLPQVIEKPICHYEILCIDLPFDGLRFPDIHAVLPRSVLHAAEIGLTVLIMAGAVKRFAHMHKAARDHGVGHGACFFFGKVHGE